MSSGARNMLESNIEGLFISRERHEQLFRAGGARCEWDNEAAYGMIERSIQPVRSGFNREMGVGGKS